MYFEEKIKDALLEAVYITRWRTDGESQYALLDTSELKETIDNIIKELDDAGFKIVEKVETKFKQPKNERKQKTKRPFGHYGSVAISV